MTKKSYNPVQSDHKLIDIIEFLHQQTGPVSADTVGRDTMSRDYMCLILLLKPPSST